MENKDYSYEEKGAKVNFRNPYKRALTIIFPDKDFKKDGRKRCDLLCLALDNYQYYIELKRTYHPEAIKQLLDTIEDLSETFPTQTTNKQAYVVYSKKMRPASSTFVQKAKAKFAERLNMVVKDAQSPFYLEIE